MVPLDLSSWLGEYWWVWLSVVTVALYFFGVQLSHGVLFAARLFAILRGCPSTLHTTVVAKNRALVRDPKLFSGTSNQFKEWVFLWSLRSVLTLCVRVRTKWIMPCRFWTCKTAVEWYHGHLHLEEKQRAPTSHPDILSIWQGTANPIRFLLWSKTSSTINLSFPSRSMIGAGGGTLRPSISTQRHFRSWVDNSSSKFPWVRKLFPEVYSTFCRDSSTSGWSNRSSCSVLLE